MKAIVLAGGFGTRLRPYTFSVPKPLLPLADRPLLDYLLAQLARCDVTDVILALGYQAELLRAYCGDGSRYGLTIAYVQESRPLGTAGPIALCRDLLPRDEPFFLANGDVVTTLDFRRLAAFHQASAAGITIAYVHHVTQSPFGVLQLEGDRVTGVVEKPTRSDPVSAGIYCLSPESAALVPPDTPLTMPALTDLVRERGGIVAACEITEFWRALETRDQFEELAAQEDLIGQLPRPAEP